MRRRRSSDQALAVPPSVALLTRVHRGPAERTTLSTELFVWATMPAMSGDRGVPVALGWTEEMVWRALGQPQGGTKDGNDNNGPFRRLRYGQHRGGGRYELEIILRNGVVVDIDHKPRAGTPTPPAAAPMPMQAMPMQAMAAPAPAPSSSSAGKIAGCLLVVLALAGGAYFLFGADSSSDAKPQRPKIPAPNR